MRNATAPWAGCERCIRNDEGVVVVLCPPHEDIVHRSIPCTLCGRRVMFDTRQEATQALQCETLACSFCMLHGRPLRNMMLEDDAA